MTKLSKRVFQRKSKYAVAARQTKWAPFWAVVKKYGKGKRVHPSYMTRVKRSWRRTKLRIKPFTARRQHLG
jgi:ribosomal protein L39E